MSKYIHKSHNVTVLLYHMVFPAKYRRVVFDVSVDQVFPRALTVKIDAKDKKCPKQYELWLGKNITYVNKKKEKIETDTGGICVKADNETIQPSVLYKKTLPLCIATSPAISDNGKFYGTAQPDCSTAIGRGVVEIEPSTGTINWGPTIASGCTYSGTRSVSVGSSGLVYTDGDWNACGRGNLIAVRQSRTL